MAQQSTPIRKRANNRQKEMLVERLHANIGLARENTAQREVIDFWISLSNELNKLGCSRTVQEWQHIWTLWVAKIKTKARKIRDTIQATGEGTVGAGLTAMEEKILDIVGFDSVNGFGDSERAFPASPQTSREPSRTTESPDSILPSVEPEIVWNTEPHNSAPTRLRRTTYFRSRGRRPFLRRPVPKPCNSDLIESINENNRLLREMITTSVETVAAALSQNSAAMVRSAEIIAAAIRSTPVPMFAPKQEHKH